MDEFKVKGIVISSIDYKENDKLVTIFTLELGKITAVFKGVKNKSAKLKFASQLFCFAEYVIIKKGEYFTAISAEQIDSFYEITQDYNKFMIGGAMLEIVNSVTQPLSINENVFLCLVKAIKSLIYEQVNEHIIFIKFALDIFKYLGYEITWNKCSECGVLIKNEAWFNFDMGSVVCNTCAMPFCTKIPKNDLKVMSFISSTEYERLKSIKVSNPNFTYIIDLIHNNFKARFGKSLKVLHHIT